MKIKDVEDKTGISVHNIRFYEEMGLIQIHRSKGSTYRDFSEKDVKKLKEIKLFRSLGITMEEIKRYYAKEITLMQLMAHQKDELKAQQNDMSMKVKLCEDIEKRNTPLIEYTVDQYVQAIDTHEDNLPYDKAGSLLASWGEQQYTKKRLIMLECIVAPVLYCFTFGILYYLFMIPDALHWLSFESVQPYIWIFALPLTFIFVYLDFLNQRKHPGELYEFCEHGIYYVNKDTRIKFHDAHKAIRSGDIQNCYDFVSYDDIKIFKVWYKSVGRAPVNGAHVYQVDFRIYTTNDEMILIDTGIVQTSDEKVIVTAQLLKQYAKKTIDPFRILEHLQDDRYAFYDYLDNIHRLREHKRVGIVD